MVERDVTIIIRNGTYQNEPTFVIPVKFQTWEISDPFSSDIVAMRAAMKFIEDNNIKLTAYGYQASYTR
jgi:hypothetical protein